MALGNKRTPRKLLKDRSGTGIIDETKLSRVSSSLASDIFTDDPAIIDGPIAPILYHNDLLQEDIDELRRYVSNDISSGGGGLTETPLAMMSGRWQWSSTDSGERIFVGSSAYGPFNYYVHANEPVAVRGNTNLLLYDSRHAVNTTTAFIYPYYAPSFGTWCPDNGKKVKVKFSFRVQSAPTNSTWGISLWDCDDPTNGSTTATTPTVTLRAQSSDITATTNSTTYWTTTATTTNTVGNKWLLPMLENRSGTLTTNTYIYGQVALYLVD